MIFSPQGAWAKLKQLPTCDDIHKVFQSNLNLFKTIPGNEEKIVVPIFYPLINYARNRRNEILIENKISASEKPINMEHHLFKGTAGSSEIVTPEAAALEAHILMERKKYVQELKDLHSRGQQTDQFSAHFYNLCSITRTAVIAYVKAFEMITKKTGADPIVDGVEHYEELMNHTIPDYQMNIMINYFLWLIKATAKDFQRRQDENKHLFGLITKFDHELNPCSWNGGFVNILQEFQKCFKPKN